MMVTRCFASELGWKVFVRRTVKFKRLTAKNAKIAKGRVAMPNHQGTKKKQGRELPQ
jgi:hypothetical protein